MGKDLKSKGSGRHGKKKTPKTLAVQNQATGDDLVLCLWVDRTRAQPWGICLTRAYMEHGARGP